MICSGTSNINTVYYNTDNSLNFPESNFLGVLVPRPSDAEIASDYDGNGSGPVPTKWYSYFIDLPSGAQAPGVRFKIVQQRNVAAGTNDNGGNTDHYGIIDFIYESKFINETVFQSSAGELSGDARTVTYTVEGDNGAQYPAGIDPDDVTLNLTAGTPLVPTAYLDPQDPIPLLEPVTKALSFFMITYLQEYYNLLKAILTICSLPLICQIGSI